MKIHSYNEWDPLKEIVVGTATGAHWPLNDPVYALESQKTTWSASAVPSGPVPDWVIDETNQDLAGLVDILTSRGVIVHRPEHIDFAARDGMYNYCPRDRLLIAGDTIVDPAMMYPCRDMEIEALDFVTQGQKVLSMPRESGMVMDAANVCRLNDGWLFLKSHSGNYKAYEWLCDQFPTVDIELVDFYSGVHIDSTIVPLREGLVMVNASRVRPDNVPRLLKNWKIIWVHDVHPQGFYQYPYASKWIAMNVLVIDPETVIVDHQQPELHKQLQSHGFTVIPHELRHSRTLGGGYHCVTLDTWRSHD